MNRFFSLAPFAQAPPPPAARRRRPALLTALAAALGLAVVPALSSCAEISDDDRAGAPSSDEPATSETTQALSVFNWTGSQLVQNGMWRSQLVTLGSRIFAVHAGVGHDYTLSWRERFGANVWGPATVIPGQETSMQVSLAAFNGYIYMIRADRSQTTKLWLSRFDPATNTWSTSYQLPHTSYGGPPAMAAYQGVLQLIGVEDRKSVV
jgi:hypothetical protein